MDPLDLERLLDRELKQLPRPRAPRTLLPRVLAATASHAGAAHATGWSTWPRAWQAAGLAVVIIAVAGVGWLLMAPPRGVTETAQTLGKAAAITRVLWDVLLQPVATYVVVAGLAITLACAAAWAALELALGGASHR